MKLYRALREKIIGEVIESYDDFYEKSRVYLTYDLSAILIALITPIVVFLFSVGIYISGTIALVAIVLHVFVIMVLKWTGRVKPAALLYSAIGIPILMLSYSPQTDSYVASNELWFVVLFLYAFFTLGFKWSLLVLAIAVGTNLYYVKFLMYDNLHNEHIYSPEKITALYVTLPIAFYGIFHIVRQYMLAQKQAEQTVRNKNNQLEEQNAVIQRQRDEKAAMIKEIHHRVKNNLQIVNSLLRLQSSEIKDEKVVSMFEDAQNRVVSMALLHDNLYRVEELNQIDMSQHFRLLSGDLIKTYGVGKTIDMDIEIGQLDIGVKTMVPLGLIINEMITNSVKYAFPDREKGKIFLSLHQLEGRLHELIIGDDGIGLADDGLKESDVNLGTELVAIFTEQLEGHITRLPQPGTVYSIIFRKIDDN